MKLARNILFFLFATVFICQLVIPMDFIVEVEDLVESSDDTESEEDNEEEKDELEWKWNFDIDQNYSYALLLSDMNIHESINSGEPSDGERVIFCPPPENLI